jgi:hypothetical protein
MLLANFIHKNQTEQIKRITAFKRFDAKLKSLTVVYFYLQF